MLKEEISAGVIIAIKEEEYKFLLLMQDKKVINWSFPKGRAEKDETPLQNALRELKEETGISDVELLDFPPIHEQYDISFGERPCLKIIRYFIGIVKDKTVLPQESEVFEYKWVGYEEALQMFVWQKETRSAVLKKAKEYLDQYEPAK